MKRLFFAILLFTIILSLQAQSLPKDLEAAVTMESSGSDEQLAEMMMNYLEIQQKEIEQAREIQRTQLDDAYKERDRILREMEIQKKIALRRAAWGGTCAIAGALLTGSYFYFHHMGNDAYENYQNATTTSDAEKYRDQFQFLDILSYSGLGLAGASIGTSIICFSCIPSKKDLKIQYHSIVEEILLLEGALE